MNIPLTENQWPTYFTTLWTSPSKIIAPPWPENDLPPLLRLAQDVWSIVTSYLDLFELSRLQEIGCSALWAITEVSCHEIRHERHKMTWSMPLPTILNPNLPAFLTRFPNLSTLSLQQHCVHGNPSYDIFASLPRKLHHLSLEQFWPAASAMFNFKQAFPELQTLRLVANPAAKAWESLSIDWLRHLPESLTILELHRLLPPTGAARLLSTPLASNDQPMRYLLPNLTALDLGVEMDPKNVLESLPPSVTALRLRTHPVDFLLAWPSLVYDRSVLEQPPSLRFLDCYQIETLRYGPPLVLENLPRCLLALTLAVPLPPNVSPTQLVESLPRTLTSLDFPALHYSRSYEEQTESIFPPCLVSLRMGNLVSIWPPLALPNLTALTIGSLGPTQGSNHPDFDVATLPRQLRALQIFGGSVQMLRSSSIASLPPHLTLLYVPMTITTVSISSLPRSLLHLCIYFTGVCPVSSFRALPDNLFSFHLHSRLGNPVPESIGSYLPRKLKFCHLPNLLRPPTRQSPSPGFLQQLLASLAELPSQSEANDTDLPQVIAQFPPGCTVSTEFMQDRGIVPLSGMQDRILHTSRAQSLGTSYPSPHCI